MPESRLDMLHHNENVLPNEVGAQLAHTEQETALLHHAMSKKLALENGDRPPKMPKPMRKDWRYFKDMQGIGFKWNNMHRIPPERRPVQSAHGERVWARFQRKRQTAQQAEEAHWRDLVLQHRDDALRTLYARQTQRVELQTRSRQDSRRDSPFVGLCQSRQETLGPLPPVTKSKREVIEAKRAKEKEDWFKAQVAKRDARVAKFEEEQASRLRVKRQDSMLALVNRVQERRNLESRSGRDSATVSRSPSRAMTAPTGTLAWAENSFISHGAGNPEGMRSKTSMSGGYRMMNLPPVTTDYDEDDCFGDEASGVPQGQEQPFDLTQEQQQRQRQQEEQQQQNRPATAVNSIVLSQGFNRSALDDAVPQLVGNWADRGAKNDFHEY